MSNFTYIGNDPTLDTTPIGGVRHVSGTFDTTNTNYLKADGSDVTSTTYPLIASQLPPATSATLRSLPGIGDTIGAIANDGAGNWLAVGQQSGFVYKSTDGISWTTYQSNYMSLSMYRYFGGGSGYIIDMIYANGKWTLLIVYSNITAVLTSVDGISWSAAFMYNGRSVTAGTAIRYLNGKYIIPMQENSVNTGYGAVLYTTDLINITVVVLSIAYHYPFDVAYGAGLYVFCSYHGSGYAIITTPDLTTFTARTTGGTGNCLSITWNGSKFVAVGGNITPTQCVYSTDGITWNTATIPTSGSYAYRSVIWANSKFVAVGAPASQITGSTTGVISYSSDGITWNTASSPANTFSSHNHASVDNSTGKVVLSALGGGTVQGLVYSTNSTSYTNSSYSGLSTYYYAVIYGPVGWLALGNNGSTTSLIGKSTDGGVSWTYINPTNITYPGTGAASATCYICVQGRPGGQQSNIIWRSADGTNWTNIATSPINMTRVLYVNNTFIIVGYNGSVPGVIHSFDDGLTWTAPSYNTAGSWPSSYTYYIDAAVGNGIFVGVTYTMWSDVGTNFSSSFPVENRSVGVSYNLGQNVQVYSTLPAMGIWSAIAYGNGVFVVTSQPSRSSWGTGTTSSNYLAQYWVDNPNTSGRMVAVSSDGISWVMAYMPVVGQWTRIIFNGTQFVAFDQNSAQYATSKDGLNWVLRNVPIGAQWVNAATDGAGTTIAVSTPGLGTAGTALRVTQSATAVTLPYVKPTEGQNFAVRVK